MGLFKKIRKHVLRLCRSIFIARVSTPREPDQDGTDRLNSPSRQAITITEGAHVDETPSKDIAIDTATVKLQPKATDLVNRRPFIAPTTLSGAGRTALDLVEAASEVFSPLKSVASGVRLIVTRIDKYEDNENLLQRLGDRVTCLNVLLKGPENGANDSNARAKLESVLKDHDKVLEPIRKAAKLERIIATDDIGRVLDAYLIKITDALSDYQMYLTTATYALNAAQYPIVSNIEHLVGQQGPILQDLQAKNMDLERTENWSLLKKIAATSRAASNQSDKRTSCWPGTRMRIQQTYQQWCDDPNSKQICWLYGHAGSGKTTISQSFAKWLHTEGKLCASFFCSRSEAGSIDTRALFPTLAYQLATTSHPSSALYKDELLCALQPHSGILELDLETQLHDFIIRPVAHSRMTAIILIDALDECLRGSAILSVLAQAISQIPSLKVFITSRPEADIRFSMRLPTITSAIVPLCLDGAPDSESQSQETRTSTDSDIRLFLDGKLTQELAQRSDVHLPQGWPTSTKKEDLDKLVKKAAGLFIFASTTVKFVMFKNLNPASQLALVLSHDTKHEGTAGLDELYTQILQCAFPSDGDTGSYLPNLRRILRLLTIALGSVSLANCGKILGIECDDIKTTLRSLHSVLHVPTAEDGKITIYHESFVDFLMDVDRCTDERFYLDRSDPEHLKLQSDYNAFYEGPRTAAENVQNKPPSAPNEEIDQSAPPTPQLTSPATARPPTWVETTPDKPDSDQSDTSESDTSELDEEDKLVRQIIAEIREKGLSPRGLSIPRRRPARIARK